MSDELTRDQIVTIQKWLGEKRKNLNCPVCNSFNSLAIQNNLIATPVFANGAMNLTGTVYPSVVLICGNCSYTQLFNAVVMGLVK